MSSQGETNRAAATQGHMADRRTDPARDGRRVAIYFAGLMAVYLFRPGVKAAFGT